MGCWWWIDPTTGEIAVSARLNNGDSWSFWVIEQPGVVMVQRTHSHVAINSSSMKFNGDFTIQKQPTPPGWSRIHQAIAFGEPAAQRTICEVAAGWPRVCLKTVDLSIENSTTRLARPEKSISSIPFIPIASGVLIDVGLYSLVWTVVLVLPFVVRRTIRFRGGLCLHCGYDLRGLPLDANCCSECGWPTPGGTDR